ncbi:tetratricopeptide repeat protein 16 [Phyllostomus hastatus]|uniref:tetratricopeptide repeat protein 16 n=1 Tax=Phyllostomus hastatus TaxID=9423 RepID=UPI001E685B66|nr:tetratricopeptide repeat protein 16 [Phyllostomus hastatus]
MLLPLTGPPLTSATPRPTVVVTCHQRPIRGGPLAAMLLRGGSGGRGRVWAPRHSVALRHCVWAGFVVGREEPLHYLGFGKSEPCSVVCCGPVSLRKPDPPWHEQAPSQHVQKSQGTPLPQEVLQRIFGTCQVFQSFEERKTTVTGITVPLKVREYYLQGYQCLEQEDWELAVLFFSRALHLDSQLVDFYALRAEAYIQLCDFSSAAQNLRRAYSFQPENTSFLERLTFVLYLQGQCLLEQGAFLDALHVFSQASELQPEKSCFHYRCMACLLALKRHDDCLSLVTEEVKHGTANADIYILRARLYNFFQKPNLCYQDLHSALQLDPKHPGAMVLLKVMVDQAKKSHQDARTLAVQGKLQQALQCIDCAIENNPLDPGLFLFRGTMYRRLQDFDAAVEDLLKALDMMRRHQEGMVQQAQRQLLLAYNDFAVQCYMQGAYQESVLLLNKALRGEQQEKGLYVNRGDCFFQLGNLAFAEADYRQALELSPHDEDTNRRMALLQEKMGFFEQKRRQFQKAENRFSMAIQHSPQRAPYYLYRARIRLLTHNVSGARQDVVTALLLDPKQPKLLPLLTDLFSGMSTEEVLRTQVAQLARLQLSRAAESRMQDSVCDSILGQLRRRELEREKARALQVSWKQERLLQQQPPQEPSEEPGLTPRALKAKPGRPKEEEAEGPKEEEKPEPAPSKARSLSDSYPDQTSSDSTLGFRTLPTSEIETSTTCLEYRSTTTSTATFSDSSVLKTQPADVSTHREAIGPSYRPRKTKAAQDQSWRSRQKPGKTEATQGPGQRPSKTKAAQGPGQRPRKTKAARGPRQRLRKTKVAHGQSSEPSKAEAARGRSWGLIRSSSKTKTFYDPSGSPGNTEATQDLSQNPSKTKAPQSWNQGSSLGSSKSEVTQDLSQNPSKTQHSPGPDSSTVL